MARTSSQTKHLRSRFWLAFDMSIRANPKAFFELLDGIGADECGPFACTFVTDRTWAQVRHDLRESAGEGIRLYLIGRRAPDGKIGGQFILGARKAAPWEGYAPQSQTIEEEEEE